MSELSRDPMRRALRAMAHGVYVLSTRCDARELGLPDLNAPGDGARNDPTHNDAARDEYLVISLAMQCSVQPPRVVFALTPRARIVAALRESGGGVLSVLHASQGAAVRRYGAPGGVKHVPPSPVRDGSGYPIPPEASHWLSVRIVQEISAGDHTMFVAEVIHAGVNDSALNDAAESSAPGATSTPVFVPLTLTASGFPYAG